MRVTASATSMWAGLRARLHFLATNPSDYVLVRGLFLRGVALVYGLAFLSLWVQVDGLIGAGGVLPAADYLQGLRGQLGSQAPALVPTLFWIESSDAMLNAVCAVGVLLAAVAVWGAAPLPCLILLWVAYLSLLSVGRDFLSFQWDILLLETGFLAILWAPAGLRPSLVRGNQPSVVVLWLIRWLTFRLMFSSGVVKLVSGDATWRDLTALTYHYQTQPLPHIISWFAHQLPVWIHKVATVQMLAIELVVPLLIFAPRRLRSWGCFVLVALQLAIAATGNYGFFNLLTVVLCLSLVDDGLLRRWLRVPSATVAESAGRRRILVVPLCALLMLLSAFQMSHTLRLQWSWPEWVVHLHRRSQPFHLVNGYGLFAVMTTQRREIQVEGSMDGKDWQPYGFIWKPDGTGRMPGFAQPHMPRLDWQMWFAALRPHRENSWFMSLMVALLQGRSEVHNLLDHNPFETEPRYLRGRLYLYEFSDWEQLWTSGRWWNRKLLGEYTQAYTLKP